MTTNLDGKVSVLNTVEPDPNVEELEEKNPPGGLRH